MVYIFLADGFEIVEAMAPLDILRRGGLDVKTVSVMGRLNVHSAQGVDVIADALYEETMGMEEAEALVLPGGLPGTTNLEACKPLCELLKKQHAAGRVVAAICAAPSVLGHLGLLEGHDATCYPGFEEALGDSYLQQSYVISEHVVTACGAGAALEFGLALLSVLKSEEKADEIARQIQYLINN